MTTDLDPNLDRRLHESQDVTSQLADKLEPRLLRSSQMVKRAKTPEVPEPCKYYTCWKPYPENADFELDEDYIKFSRWIANILGQSGPLYALYYKPRVSAVIFAVDKTYPHPERLLGEHRWKEFLLNPDKSEAELKSQIFYCTYSTEREVQKDGWKEIPIQDDFFNRGGRFTKVLYPAPHWCAVPSENMTEKPLCRPLPHLQVPKPSQASKSVPKQRPVVGSSDWAQIRDKNANSKSAPPPIGVIGGHTGSQNKVPAAAKGKGAKTGGTLTQTSFPPLRSPASPAGNASSPTSAPRATSAHSVWANKPPNVKSATSPLPAPSSTPHLAWKTKQSTSRTGQRPRSSSSSSRHSGGCDTISAASSAPSSPSSPARGTTINLDVSEYNDDDEEITEETYHEDWETASAYQPSEASAPAVSVGKNAANRWEYPPFLAAIERGEEEVAKPAEETNLWANTAIISPITSSAAAAEAHAKKLNEVVVG
ncbi:hypothetical protein AX14_013281 [Amanita brunnescens Koide BX004]|nr:hypothetical protein AX14_013281 [Amanita brunnescens Koide BX004]